MIETKTDHTLLHSVLSAVRLFEGLNQRELDALARDLQPRHFAAQEVIFQEGEMGKNLYVVQSGQVRIFVNGLDGSETSVILMGRPGDIFGELAVIDGLPRSASAIAMDDTLVYTMHRGNFRDHMRNSPQLALNFMKALSQRVRYNTRQVGSLAGLDVPGRLARKLLDLAQDYGRVETDGVRINIALTQTEIATMVGATRERINKVLRTWRRDELVRMDNGYIVILDAEGLRSIVAGL